MRLESIYTENSKKPAISFEVFPPKNLNNESESSVEQKFDNLISELYDLKKFNPALVSITYGAMGSSRDNTLKLAKRIKNELNLIAMPHFTCINSTKEFIETYLQEIKNEGFKNILALRGDAPLEQKIIHRDFKFANELVEFIGKKTDLSIAVAGYPEGHTDCCNIKKDIENLKKKIDAGAQVIFTQLFFDNSYFFKYKELLQKAEIKVPVVAGILPILNYKQIEKMTQMCKVEIPLELKNNLEKFKTDNESVKQLGIDYATYQTKGLIDFEVDGLHFYTLNKSYSVKKILENI